VATKNVSNENVGNKKCEQRKRGNKNVGKSEKEPSGKF
jgi:hypothetical protein